jgi:putative transcriptional regulator
MTNKIAEYRKKRNLTQPQLATVLGFKTYQSIQQLENGRRIPSVEVAIRIARALNATVEEIFVIDD